VGLRAAAWVVCTVRMVHGRFESEASGLRRGSDKQLALTVSCRRVTGI